jgi:hypothetical protein
MTVEIKSGRIGRRFQSIEWGCLLDVRHAPMAIEFCTAEQFPQCANRRLLAALLLLPQTPL